MRFSAPTRRVQLKWQIALPAELSQVISQIDFRIEKGFGNIVVEEGISWIELSISEIHQQDFWWIPKTTLKKQLDRLVQRGVLLRDQSVGRPNRWAIAPESQTTNGPGSKTTNGPTFDEESQTTNGPGSKTTNGPTPRPRMVRLPDHGWSDSLLIDTRARVLENESKIDDEETSSPSTAPGSTFGENRIADLSFENNLNNSEDPASPDAPTPPLPPLAPGYPTEWSKYDAWVEMRFVHYGHAAERVCGLSFASQFSGHFERVTDACDYVETGLRNMQVDGFDTKKVTRALGHTRNIRQYLDQLRQEAKAKEITVDDLSTDPVEVERRQQERKRRQEEEFKRDCEAPMSPEDLEYVEEGLKMIEQWNRQKALREELLERERQRGLVHE